MAKSNFLTTVGVEFLDDGLEGHGDGVEDHSVGLEGLEHELPHVEAR
jgi:hypothetical protein